MFGFDKDLYKKIKEADPYDIIKLAILPQTKQKSPKNRPGFPLTSAPIEAKVSESESNENQGITSSAEVQKANLKETKLHGVKTHKIKKIIKKTSMKIKKNPEIKHPDEVSSLQEFATQTIKNEEKAKKVSALSKLLKTSCKKSSKNLTKPSEAKKEEKEEKRALHKRSSSSSAENKAQNSHIAFPITKKSKEENKNSKPPHAAPNPGPNLETKNVNNCSRTPLHRQNKMNKIKVNLEERVREKSAPPNPLYPPPTHYPINQPHSPHSPHSIRSPHSPHSPQSPKSPHSPYSVMNTASASAFGLGLGLGFDSSPPAISIAFSQPNTNKVQWLIDLITNYAHLTCFSHEQVQRAQILVVLTHTHVISVAYACLISILIPVCEGLCLFLLGIPVVKISYLEECVQQKKIIPLQQAQKHLAVPYFKKRSYNF